MKVSLWVGLIPAVAMSIAGLFIMYPSIRAIEYITRDAESFIRHAGKDGLNLVSSGDEAEKIAYYTSQMIMELKRKIPGMEDFALQMDNANRKLLQFAIKDGLTGLYNQSCIKERLSSELARARQFGHHLSVVMLDIDDFKDYNDTYGHLAGDEALKNIALTIAQATRPMDIPSRYGGEEFMIVLPETGENEALCVARRIRRSIAEKDMNVSASEKTANLTVSAGVSGYPDSGEILTSEQLIETADKYLYEAKRSGKNVVFPTA
jgi:diguanylate cyclase (GGDEF)-like protein